MHGKKSSKPSKNHPWRSERKKDDPKKKKAATAFDMMERKTKGRK